MRSKTSETHTLAHPKMLVLSSTYAGPDVVWGVNALAGPSVRVFFLDTRHASS